MITDKKYSSNTEAEKIEDCRFLLSRMVTRALLLERQRRAKLNR